MCSFWKERFVKNAILWDIISVSILEQGPSPALKSGGLAANEDQYLARNWIDARDAKSWMMMMLCSLIPIGPYFGSGDLSCSRISSLIQIEAKHIKHSNEEQYGGSLCSEIGKKCNFQSTKTHYLHFQKLQKINLCTKKKFKTTKNPVFLSPKIAFLVVLNFFQV